ncbi:fungal-specific transcription factor domain-containing protein [Aspergillus floccosus]
MSNSSLILPELTGSTLTDPLSLDSLNGSPPTMADSTSKMKMTDLVRAELDQIYFDRVHAFCPIIHRRRYFASLAQDNHTPAQLCLQSAMRALAAAMSAHSSHLSEQYYSETRSLLDTHSQTPATPRDKIPLEHIQAWLLLSHYELLRIGVHQAMLTAGRAFRLVQMARLCEIDAPGGDLQLSPVASSSPSLSTSPDSSESFVDAEEGRRTFWLAFCLDRLLCLQNEWPLTLQEEMVSTRLPSPEANFQNNQPIRTSFLADALAQTSPSTLSPFAECIIMATLHGRCMTHRRLYATEFEAGTRDFCIRQGWLATAVERRVQMLVPSPAVDSDPMLLFTHMLAYRATVHLSITVQQASWRTVDQQVLAAAYQQRAAQAASEIVRLAKAVPYLSPFKTHPFLPDTLACAATFLSTQTAVEGGGDDVQYLLRVLGELQDTHSLARDYVQTLKLHAQGNRQDGWY